MADADKTRTVSKLLTYVFEDEAPLLAVERLELTDGIYLAPIPQFLLHADDNYHLLAVRPQFSQFFRDHLHQTTLNVTYMGQRDLNYEANESEETSAQRKVENYLLSAMVHSPHFLAPHAVFVTIPSTKHICHSSRMMDFCSASVGH